MINYDGRFGLRLRNHLKSLGYDLWYENFQDGTSSWMSSSDTEVQPLVDNFDALTTAKNSAKDRIGVKATELLNIIYPHAPNGKYMALSFIKYTLDVSKTPFTSRVQQIEQIRIKAKVKIAEVNAMTDWKLVDAYDASVGW